MNNNHINGERRLFVSMVKNDLCITQGAEGIALLWQRLCDQTKGKKIKPKKWKALA